MRRQMTMRELVRALPDLLDHIEHFQHRVIQDALAEATSNYWLRRAEVFDAVGNERCDVVAQACRNAAVLALLQDDEAPAAITCGLCMTPTSPWSCSCGATRLPEVA